MSSKQKLKWVVFWAHLFIGWVKYLINYWVLMQKIKIKNFVGSYLMFALLIILNISVLYY